MNRQAQAVILLLLGGAVIRASLTDLYLNYVKEGLRPFLVAAGILLVVAAIMTLWYELRPARPIPAPAGATGPDGSHGPGDPDGHGHDDGHGHHEPRVGWLLILPVLGLLLVAPPALGSYAAGQAGTALSSQQQPSDYPPLPAGDPVQVSVLDYASRALFDKGTSIGDRRVRLTGFITAGPDGRPILARMVLSCCAADGRPVKLGMTGNAPTGLADDTWVEVTGRYSDQVTRDPVNDAEIPYLDVESWTQVPAPKRQYE
ncbi:TIGR03943 family putative permease subunit [Micromonospora endolithica]|uniref:TIGR03943 family protein n=1 Tax=Micromonospora endolithica TaxID=230091 RepID=A0A3A9Z321_9ACTN|nr:TIGR03943 family protein [Micromonospora endolithica]RKN42683.1 TIGR03943 family protein [Micromonospora endolithica]TWJ20065.1 putative repeat protein (TIGR03943 family) [Micromonospora endolithica]